MASEAMAGLHGSRHPSAVPHDLSELIWSVPEIISIASRSTQLRPGDLIFAGTPAGVGRSGRGALMTGGIDRLGEISISVW
jgi:fumarylpyruvate hydrolase